MIYQQQLRRERKLRERQRARRARMMLWQSVTHAMLLSILILLAYLLINS